MSIPSGEFGKSVSHQISFRCDFYPVGQGLFAAGRVQSKDGQRTVRWVYDCGTTSPQKLITTAIRQLGHDYFNGVNGKKRLNLVVLSHFDNDHISGVVRLLQEYSVEVLLLPYIPLWQRLLVAFDLGVDTQQDLMTFYLNPAQYLSSRSDAEAMRIVFVPPSGGESEDIGGQFTTAPLPGVDNDNWRLNVPTMRPNLDGPPNDFDVMEHKGGGNYQAELMTKRSSIRVNDFWEFIPYNDAELASYATGTFQKKVARMKTQLMSGSPASAAALKDLKAAYDHQFGANPERRNLLSLFLYCGPLHEQYVTQVQAAWTVFGQGLVHRNRWGPATAKSGGCATLYSGDGYLNSTKRLEALCAFLGPVRIRNVGVFQVMHHGAKANWHSGVAARIAPEISVFSSDPAHKMYLHPHAPVIHDFWRYNPVQVDKMDALVVEGDVAW